MKNQQTNNRNTRIFGTVAMAPQVRTTASGKQMATCMILSHEKSADENGNFTSKKVWRRVTAWGKQGVFMARYFTQGRPVTLECSERHVFYTNMEGKKKNVHEFTLSKVSFLGKEVQSVIKTPAAC